MIFGCKVKMAPWRQSQGHQNLPECLKLKMSVRPRWHQTLFTARAYARAVLGVVILSVYPSVCPSICPSVCLSHAWIMTKLNDALQIFLYHTKGQSLCYSDTNSGWWATPPSLWNLLSKWPAPFEKCRLRPIFAHNVLTVGDSEKSYDEYKVDHGLSNEP